MCFDIDRFVEKKLASHFLCTICKCVLCCPQENKKKPTSKQEPNNNNRAGHKYCEECIVKWLNENESCPDCREHLKIEDLQTIDRSFFNIFKELQIHCKYFSKGCQFTANLDSIEQHELTQCQYGIKKCVNCEILYSNTIHTEKECIKNLIEIVKTKDNQINQSYKQVELLNNEIKKLQFENDELKTKFVTKDNKQIETLKNNQLKSEENHANRLSADTSNKVISQTASETQTATDGVAQAEPVQTVSTSADNHRRIPELSAKTTFQRNAKGPVSISECSPDGKVIILENTSRNKDVVMSNWVIKRRTDNKPEITYKFPENLTIKAYKVLRIWVRGHGKENLPTDLVNKDIENWGMGVNIVTIVLNDRGDEMATHLQKTVFAC